MSGFEHHLTKQENALLILSRKLREAEAALEAIKKYCTDDAGLIEMDDPALQEVVRMVDAALAKAKAAP